MKVKVLIRPLRVGLGDWWETAAELKSTAAPYFHLLMKRKRVVMSRDTFLRSGPLTCQTECVCVCVGCVKDGWEELVTKGLFRSTDVPCWRWPKRHRLACTFLSIRGLLLPEGGRASRWMCVTWGKRRLALYKERLLMVSSTEELQLAD